MFLYLFKVNDLYNRKISKANFLMKNKQNFNQKSCWNVRLAFNGLVMLLEYSFFYIA